MLEFNAASLSEQLQGLPHRARAAFALACATRLASWIPSSESLAQSARQLADDFVQGNTFNIDEARQVLEQLDESPDLDTDPVSSSYYALTCCITGEAQQAFWAAQVAYDATDSEAQRLLQINEFSPATEAQLRHLAKIT
jgi:hypothetical protein